MGLLTLLGRPLLQSVRGGRSLLLPSHDVFSQVHNACKNTVHCSIQVSRLYHSTKETQRQESVVLYDSLSDSYKALPLNDSNKGLAWYTCGPTTYAPAHMGHARTYVCLDILRRVLEHFNERNTPPPLFVMNITDVDDKILAAAEEIGEPPLDLARRFERDFWRDWDALGCLRPHVVTRVTEHVETDIVSYIQRLVESGMAYAATDGVYFDVREYESKMGHVTKYGKLAPPSASSDFYSSHGPVEEKKQDPRDFCLWKLRKEGESLYWQSPWGEGRPGWHIECSAMIKAVQRRFQDTHEFRVHAGGVDLKFPHHTNEIAQAEAFHYHDQSFAGEWIAHWVHTGHLHIRGMKMSKSLKNFITIEELLSEKDTSMLSSPADDFRLWCLGLSGSYRGPATYSKDRLDEARVTREKIVRFLLDGEFWIREADESAPKRWRDQDHELFDLVNNAAANSRRAIVGWDSSEEDNHTTKEFDLEGSTFVEEMLRIVDAGNDHMRGCSVGDAPIEPVRAAVDTLRDLLSLVGFSDDTVNIGLENSKFEGQQDRVVGGEEALIEELVRFRSAIRKAALSDVRDKTATDNVKEILKLCDNIRKEVLPTMGLELQDDKVDDDSAAAAGWRLIVPKKGIIGQDSLESPKTKDKASRMGALHVPVQEFFQTGQYEGMFSKFNDDGIPVLTADSSKVSKRLLKKLLKKRKKYEQRLQDKPNTK